MVDTELSRRNLVRNIALQVSSFLVVPQMVVESDLIITGPALLLRRLSAHQPVVLLKPPLSLPPFELCLAWHSRHENDPPSLWMRDVITRAAQSLSASAPAL